MFLTQPLALSPADHLQIECFQSVITEHPPLDCTQPNMYLCFCTIPSLQNYFIDCAYDSCAADSEAAINFGVNLCSELGAPITVPPRPSTTTTSSEPTPDPEPSTTDEPSEPAPTTTDVPPQSEPSSAGEPSQSATSSAGEPSQSAPTTIISTTSASTEPQPTESSGEQPSGEQPSGPEESGEPEESGAPEESGSSYPVPSVSGRPSSSSPGYPVPSGSASAHPSGNVTAPGTPEPSHVEASMVSLQSPSFCVQ